jgi:hypothetical protein
MPRRAALLFSVCVLCLLVFAALIYLANHFYWGLATMGDPTGEYFLFHRALPRPVGHLLWVGIKPLLVIAPIAAVWSLVHAIRSWRQFRKPGHCPKCGYDLRATPDRCPECGWAVSR